MKGRDKTVERFQNEGKLVGLLRLKLAPVGVFFGNTDAECDLVPSPDTRNCVAPLLLASARGQVVALDEDSCNCPGGAVGCCFGDGFTRRNPRIHEMLAQGVQGVPDTAPIHMREGERFLCSSDIAMNWRQSIPYSERAYPRIVFAPLSRWECIGEPDLVFVFADPDQISALVTMLGFRNGRAQNAIAPFGAACQSILFAAEQLDAEEPLAVLGLFDISQRRKAVADYLSLTMPTKLFRQMAADLPTSCLTTHAWHEIEKRYER